MPKIKQLTIKGVSEELHALIASAAESKGLRKSSWIRDTLREAVEVKAKDDALQKFIADTLALLQEGQQGQTAVMAKLEDLSSMLNDIMRVQHHFLATLVETKNKPPDH